MGREIVIGLHFYQPPREATHPLISGISTDPENKNWTKIIEAQCYRPLTQEGVLKKASFDIYQSLLIQLEKINPETALVFKQSMKENGIGEAFIHPILPDLSRDDKQIIIRAGVNRFKEITGTNPKIFWPPETAIDTETLEVLSENGYQGFVCAPEQIMQNSSLPSDNQPTRISLSKGKQIIAYPFDRPISSALAFDKKLNADDFTRDFIKPKSDNTPKNQVLIAWTDAETFGHHYQNGDRFLQYLLDSALPSAGLFPVSINSVAQSSSDLPFGKIRERSAWSCPHGNLIRWNGTCDCGFGEDTTWKKPFAQTMNYLNDQMTSILINQFGSSYQEEVSKNFYQHYSQQDVYTNSKSSLIAAKVSSLIAKTSCGTFFSSPEVSGKIMLLYAYQSLLYLKDAGLFNTAVILENDLFQKLEKINYPHGNGSARDTLEKMLNQ